MSTPVALDAFATPKPNYIKRLERAPLISRDPSYVPGQIFEDTRTLLTKKEQVEARKKLLCIHDLQPFEGDPFYIPVAYSEQLDQYTVRDAACSVNCAIMHVMGQRRLNAQTVLPLITLYASDVFGLDEPFFEPSPARSALATGAITLEEHRANFVKLVNKKPWKVVHQGMTTVSQALFMEPRKRATTHPPPKLPSLPSLSPPPYPLGTILCICDMQPFTTKPFHIPLKYDDTRKKFTCTLEASCGPACAKQYVLSDKRFSAHVVLPLIDQCARTFGYGLTAPAPSRSLLASGKMSLEEYRSGLDKNLRPNLVNHNPWMFAVQGVTAQGDSRNRSNQHRNASVAALAASGVFYNEGSGEKLPQPRDICDAIVTTIRDREQVHRDTSVNDPGLTPVESAALVPRRAMGMTVTRAPRMVAPPPSSSGSGLGVLGVKRGLDVFLESR